MKLLKNFGVLLLLITLTNCEDDDSNGDTLLESNPAIVARIMNENLVLPAGSFTVNPEDVEIDESITINPSSGVAPITAGQQMGNTISFNAPNGNVNAVGMRFGTTGPIYFVPINTNGNTSGTGTFDFLINAGICSRLSQICHDIRCYEFAQTTSGSISRENIRDVAMLCGNCNEPSCQGLVDPSDCNNTQGMGNFTSSVTGNESGTSACSSETTSVSGNSWVLILSNVGNSGSFNINSDYYTNSCTSCPALQVSDSNGNTYIANSGSASWSGSTLSFNVTIKTIPDTVNGGGPSYNLTGTINCN